MSAVFDRMNGNSCITVFIVAGVKGLWLELAIVADHTMLKFHGRERVKHYILALMNIVSRNHEICTILVLQLVTSVR